MNRLASVAQLQADRTGASVLRCSHQTDTNWPKLGPEAHARNTPLAAAVAVVGTARY